MYGHAPMRKTLTALGLATVAVAGCGGGPPADDPASVSEAAEATRLARTAKVGWRVTTSGFGLGKPVTVRGSGTTSLTAPEMGVKFDLAPALRGAGARADVVLRGSDVYVRMPRLDLPDGADWVSLDVRRALRAGGHAEATIAEVLALDPRARIDQLAGASRVQEVGSTTIDGAVTTHYRARARGRESAPFEVWIDERDRVRRIRQRSLVEAQPGVPRGELGVTMDLSDFGADVAARAPARRDTYDATSRIGSVLAASR